jgi:hypothetical protein
MRTSAFVLILFFLFTGTCSAAEKGKGIQSLSKLTHIRNSGPVFFTEAAYEGLEELRRGHADKAYALWVEEGFTGNLDALAMVAMLCAVEEKKPSAGWKVRWQNEPTSSPVCPVPAKFWEDNLISLLGEGEGTFVLGLFGMELMDVDPHRKKSDYMSLIEDYMLRSAVTGHADGMYGAWLTGENRKGAFTPPAERPDLPVLPEGYEPDSTYEQRYWGTHSAHAGNWMAMDGMGWAFLIPPPPCKQTRKLAQII